MSRYVGQRCVYDMRVLHPFPSLASHASAHAVHELRHLPAVHEEHPDRKHW
jgi:hypothetical protein